MHGEQRKRVGADRIEGDIAEVEKASEPDHDIEAEAEHHIGEDEDRQVEQVADRQAEMEGLLDDVGEDGEEHRGGDEKQRAVVGAIAAHRRDRPDRAPGGARHLPVAVPPEEVEQEPADKDDADHGCEQHRARFEREPADAVDGLEAEREAEEGEGHIGREQRVGNSCLEPVAQSFDRLGQGPRPSLPQDGRAGPTGRR